MYKIAISDLDGTLLGPDHRISDKTRASIQDWLDDGRKFVIATGRHYIEAKSLQASINTPLYLITSNGARVHDKNGEIILEQNLPSDVAQSICELALDPQVQVNLFNDQHWHANFRVKELDDIGLGIGFDCQSTDLVNLDKSNTIKIFFWAEPEKLQPIFELLKERFGEQINLTFSLAKCLEVMHADVNKGAAVEAVLKAKQLDVKHSIAFGDGMNDVEMLNVVAKPILMANSQADLCKALPEAEKTLSAKDHGVAVVMNQLLADSK